MNRDGDDCLDCPFGMTIVTVMSNSFGTPNHLLRECDVSAKSNGGKRRAIVQHAT
jgi:hypothetical protein